MSKKEELNFSKAEQGAIIETPPGKIRITIRLVNNVINWFRKKVNESGGGS